MKKIVILSLFTLLPNAFSYGQEKPVRIGLKFGIPNVAGLSLEYATPLLNNKLATAIDFSTISISAGETKVSFSYIEAGGNYYFLNDGRGLYGNIGFGRIGSKVEYEDPILGTGEGKAGINLINLKIGGKFGNGFYFRPEIGYAMLAGNSEIEVEYTDPSTNNTVVEREEIPGFLSGGTVFNVGFGVAF